MPIGKNAVIIVYWEGNASFVIAKPTNASIEKGLGEVTDCPVRVLGDASLIDFRLQDLHTIDVVLTDRDSDTNDENEIRHHAELLRVSIY